MLPTKGASVKGDTVSLSPEARRALNIRTVDVQERALEQTILAPAAVVLRPEAHAFATSLLAGRVEEVIAKPGQTVRAGDVLAHVRSQELERLILDRTTTQLDLRLAEQNLELDTDLARRGSLPQNELLISRNRRDEKANAATVARLKLQALGIEGENAGENVNLLPIRSPIAGVVAHADVHPGMVVEPQQHLFDIVDISRVRIRADVPEAYVPKISVGSEAYIRLSSHAQRKEPFRGVLRARAGKVRPNTLAESVWIDLHPVSVPLSPGMTGQAQIVVSTVSKVVAIPEAAIIRDGMETHVFVQTEPGKYQRTRFTTGLKTAGFVQATSHVLAGDAVVAQGQRQMASFFVQGVLRPTAEARRNAGLRIEPVTTHSIAPILTMEATIELPTANKTLVASPLPAKIVELVIDQPQDVAEGRELARLASLELQSLELELVQSSLDADLHRRSLAAYRKANVDQRSVIARQIAEAELGLKNAEARTASVIRRLQMIGLAPADIETIRRDHRVSGMFTLRAPRKGQAIPFELVSGQVVKVGDPLFEIQDRSQVWVRGRVFDQELPQIAVGQPVRLRLASDPEFLQATKISRLDSLPDSDGRSRAVWAELENADGRLRENMLGRLTVEVGPATRLLAVPISALYRDGSRFRVFVYDAKTDQFQLRPVNIGRRDDRFVEVTDGLKTGEQIAVTAVTELFRSYGRIK